MTIFKVQRKFLNCIIYNYFLKSKVCRKLETLLAQRFGQNHQTSTFSQLQNKSTANPSCAFY
jgi:hypothetical protein